MNVDEQSCNGRYCNIYCDVIWKVE